MTKPKKYVSRDPNSPENWTWDEDLTRNKVASSADKILRSKTATKAEKAAAASALTQKVPRSQGWADEGKKADDGKLPFDLLPHDAITEIVKVLQFGAIKYEARNWEKGMHWSRPYAALMRHMYAWWRGQENDPETGLSHLAHAGCCLLFLLSFVLRQHGTDDRANMETPLDEH